MSLKVAIRNKNITEIRKITKNLRISEIIAKVKTFSLKECLIFFRALETKEGSEIFAEIGPEYQEKIIKSFTDQELKQIIKELFSDEIADLIEEVPDEIAKRILRNIPKNKRADINRILRYDDSQTGSIMTVDIVTIKEDWTVKESISHIRKHKDKKDLFHYFFVVDKNNKLSGCLAIENLIFADYKIKIKNIKKPVASVYTTTDKEEAAKKFAEEDMSVLPVVNHDEEVLGAIRADDVIDIVQEAATEDIHKMAGIKSSDDFSYLKQTSQSIFKSRIIWLLLLMISATLSQIVLDQMQSVSNRFLQATVTTAIVAILPVISGAAGNAGSQSSTTIIRSIATGDIGKKAYWKVIGKELRVATLVGLSLGAANFIRLVLYYLGKDHTIDNQFLILSFAASLSLFVVIILAKFIGSLLPLMALKSKIDPAVIAAPLLTTFIDALSTAIFFGISVGIMYAVMF